MNKKLILISIIILFFIIILFNNVKVTQKYEMPIIIKVTKSIGIIVDTDKLYYSVNPGGTSTRSIILQNNYHKNVIIELKTNELSNWIIISKEKFILKSNETKKLDIIINPPPSTKIGVYNSTLFVNIKGT